MRHHVLAARAGRVAEGGRRERCASAAIARARADEVAVRRRGLGEVRLEDDDPARPLERADARGRATGGARRVGKRRRRGDGEGRLEPIHGGRQRRVRGRGAARPGDGPSRRRGSAGRRATSPSRPSPAAAAASVAPDASTAPAARARRRSRTVDERRLGDPPPGAPPSVRERRRHRRPARRRRRRAGRAGRRGAPAAGGRERRDPLRRLASPRESPRDGAVSRTTPPTGSAGRPRAGRSGRPARAAIGAVETHDPGGSSVGRGRGRRARSGPIVGIDRRRARRGPAPARPIRDGRPERGEDAVGRHDRRVGASGRSRDAARPPRRRPRFSAVRPPLVDPVDRVAVDLDLADPHLARRRERVGACRRAASGPPRSVPVTTDAAALDREHPVDREGRRARPAARASTRQRARARAHRVQTRPRSRPTRRGPARRRGTSPASSAATSSRDLRDPLRRRRRRSS